MFLFFFFNDTATTEIYTLSLHDALPIFVESQCAVAGIFDAGTEHDMAFFLLRLTEISLTQPAVRRLEHVSGTERFLPEPVTRTVVVQSDGLSVTSVRLYDPGKAVPVKLGRDGAVLLQEISCLDRIGAGDSRFLERMPGIDPAAA